MGETLRTRREVLQGLTTAIAAASAAAPAADAHGKSRARHASRRPNIVLFLGEGIIGMRMEGSYISRLS